MDRRRKKSPQGQENMNTNGMTEDDIEEEDQRYQHRELYEIKMNADKALQKALEAYEAAKLKAESFMKPMSHADFERKWAQMERDEMIREMPRLPKLRNKTKSHSVHVKRSKKTRKTL
jgi:hypothetical protein